MKTLKELEKEYNQYQIGENVIDNFEEFYAYLNDVINNVSKNWEDAFNQITENNRWQRISKIRNLLPFLFIQEDTTFYDYDNNNYNLTIYDKETFYEIHFINNNNIALNMEECISLTDVTCENNKIIGKIYK